MNGRDLLDAMEYISDDLIEEAATEWIQKGNERKVTVRKWVATAAGIAVLCVSALALNEWKHTMFHSNSSTSNNSGANDMNFSSSVTTDTATKEENAQEDNMAATGEIIDQSTSTSLDTQVAYDDMYKQNSIKEEVSKYESAFIIEDFPPKHPYREPSESITDVASYVPPKKGTYSYSQMLTEALKYYDSEEGNTGSALAENLEKPYNVYHVVIKLFSDREENGNVVYGELELNENSEALLTGEYERLSEQGYDVSLSEDYELEGLFTKSELETFDVLPEYGYIFSLVSE